MNDVKVGCGFLLFVLKDILKDMLYPFIEVNRSLAQAYGNLWYEYLKMREESVL